MLKNSLGTLGLVFGLAVSLIGVYQWVTAPVIKLRANVESGLYKNYPSVQKFIDAPLLDVDEVAANLVLSGQLKKHGLSIKEAKPVAELLRQQRFDIKYSLNNSAKNFLIYKIENTGDKSALKVALVNSLDGVALIDEEGQPLVVKEKDSIELGEIAPRSEKTVYFWASSYYYSRWDKAFVRHSDGAVDVESTVPLGGWYKHFYDYNELYKFLVFVIVFSLLLAFGAHRLITRASTDAATKASIHSASSGRKRRRRRPKAKVLPAPPTQG